MGEAMIHPLSRWLFEHEKTAHEFAADIKVSSGYLSEVLAYKKMPSFDFMDKVKKGTKGAIRPNDFERPPPPKKQRKGKLANA